MGWLVIDTRVNGHSVAAWIEGEHKEVLQIEGKAARVLVSLARICESHKKQIEGIMIAAGPGTFSAVRTGVLYANLMARLLHVPLLSLSEEEAPETHWAEVIRAFQTGQRAASSYVAPMYDREPNITFPKQT